MRETVESRHRDALPLSPGGTMWIDPQAPHCYGVGRRCERCKARVNRYQGRQGSDTQGPQGPLLCYRCAEKVTDAEFEKELQKVLRKAEAESLQPVNGNRVRKARKRRGLSQFELAMEAGLKHGQHISGIERGRQNCGRETLARIAFALDVPEDYLRGEDS